MALREPWQVNGTPSYHSQVKMSDIKKTKPRSPNPSRQNTYPAGSIRERILEAAFRLFSECGSERQYPREYEEVKTS
jgi:hypothetical protein